MATTDPTTVRDLAEHVMAYALAHYEDGGWDVIVETKSVDEIAAELADAGVTTAEAALAHYGDVVEVWAERQADARNSAF